VGFTDVKNKNKKFSADEFMFNNDQETIRDRPIVSSQKLGVYKVYLCAPTLHLLIKYTAN